MEIIPVKLPNSHNLVFCGDFHEGTIMQHQEGIDQLIDYVLSDNNTYVAIGGDLVECRAVDNPMFDIRLAASRSDLPLKQFFSITNKLKPIKHRILVCLYGNHDWDMGRAVGNGVRDIFCKELKVRYGSFSCKLIIYDKKGNLMYKAFQTHGRKMVGSTADDPIRREANMKLQLKRHLQYKAGDTVIMSKGHSHKLLVVKPSNELYLVDDGDRIIQKYTYDVQNENYIDPDLRYYINSGSFLKLYVDPIEVTEPDGSKGIEPVSGYAERGEYDPVELGFAVAKIRDKKVIDVERVVL